MSKFKPIKITLKTKEEANLFGQIIFYMKINLYDHATVALKELINKLENADPSFKMD
jgi:hypothetical protein